MATKSASDAQQSGEEKKHLVSSRLLPRLRELGTDFDAYFARIRDDLDERRICIELLCTHETSFYRESAHFELLAEAVYPRWLAEAAAGNREPVVRAWSAGCASGEEPYSIAIQLLHHFPASAGWKVEVLATDLSTRALAMTKAATWSMDRSQPIPTRWLHRLMLRGTGSSEGLFRAGRELRATVRCAPFNLVRPETVLPTTSPRDLVFCRNVLIYFAKSMQTTVVERLAPGGVLLLGHTESLAGGTLGLASIGPTAWHRPGPTP